MIGLLATLLLVTGVLSSNLRKPPPVPTPAPIEIDLRSILSRANSTEFPDPDNPDYHEFLSRVALESMEELDDRAINSCDCAPVSSAGRIVGGQEVNPKYKLPYQVLFNPIMGGYIYTCGGTIVNKRYVITAAHCLFNKDGVRMTPENANMRVIVGEHDKCDGVNEGGQTFKAAAITMHPSYGVADRYDSDIAVIKLDKDITFTAKVKPACLPTSVDKDYAGNMATISGWGGTRAWSGQQVEQPRQCVMKESSVKILSTAGDKCSSFLRTTSSSTKLCAWSEGTDTCQGDSGGPLTVAEGGKYVLVGVVSYGAGCAASTPGIYARVQGFMSWITPIISDGACSGGGVTTAAPSTGGTSGTIQSDNYPANYPDSQDKTYTITVAAGKRVELTFVAFDIEAAWDCGWDYLMVNDGDGSSLLGKTCGNIKPGTITSKTNRVNVIFHSDFYYTLTGFKINWKEV